MIIDRPGIGGPKLRMPWRKKRSGFAESAYVAALSSAPTDDDVVRADFSPLAGASVAVLANAPETADPRALRLREKCDSIGCAVESLGGRWVPFGGGVDDGVTHAIFLSPGNSSHINFLPGFLSCSVLFNGVEELTSEAMEKVNTCLANNIPLVSPEWLKKVGELGPGQHWSDVDVAGYVPEELKLFVFDHASPTLLGGGRTLSSRRDARASLSASIGQTYEDLLGENPELLERETIERVMERSLLDFALVDPPTKTGRTKGNPDDNPYLVLRIERDASPDQIKKAYRKRAIETHPDKGGDSGEFARVAQAYRSLLPMNNDLQSDGSCEGGGIPLKSSGHWDSELKSHKDLVQELYAAHGRDGADGAARQENALSILGLRHKDAGSMNYNEENILISNSCFYLSLAYSYLSNTNALAVGGVDDFVADIDEMDLALLREADRALIRQTALRLKRIIEAAVLAAHPDWAARKMVGEDVQAFSDFLVYSLGGGLVGSWAVVVFDTTSGFADVYKGQGYDEGDAACATLTLRFVPGHYQPLIADTDRQSSLSQILLVLDECGVLYVVTDGAAPEG